MKSEKGQSMQIEFIDFSLFFSLSLPPSCCLKWCIKLRSAPIKLKVYDTFDFLSRAYPLECGLGTNLCCSQIDFSLHS